MKAQAIQNPADTLSVLEQKERQRLECQIQRAWTEANKAERVVNHLYRDYG